MTLPQEPVLSLLKTDFVVGWKNIRKEDYVGASRGYTCEQSAVGTTNGAGARNVQMFVLSPDGVVLHCLPGFWHPTDLAYELRLAKVLHQLWRDDRSIEDKREMYSSMQLLWMRQQSKEMLARSDWQGFDAHAEKSLLAIGPRDTFYYENGEPKTLKPVSIVVHERLSTQPFCALNKFDTESLIDYGLPYYDNNRRVDPTGVEFGSEGYMESQRRMAERKQKRNDRKRKKVGKDDQEADEMIRSILTRSPVEPPSPSEPERQ